jgi:hypothetical protein
MLRRRPSRAKGSVIGSVRVPRWRQMSWIEAGPKLEPKVARTTKEVIKCNGERGRKRKSS